MPVSGMGCAQHLVLALADMGGRAASVVRKTFAIASLDHGRVAAPESLPASCRPALGAALLRKVCMRVVNAKADVRSAEPWVERRVVGTPNRAPVAYDKTQLPTGRFAVGRRGGCGQTHFA